MEAVRDILLGYQLLFHLKSNYSCCRARCLYARLEPNLGGKAILQIISHNHGLSIFRKPLQFPKAWFDDGVRRSNKLSWT